VPSPDAALFKGHKEDIKKENSVWVVSLFGDVYITTRCFDRSVKTCDDINTLWEFNNRADFVAQSFTTFNKPRHQSDSMYQLPPHKAK